MGAIGKDSSPRGHGRVPSAAWLFEPFKGMTPVLSPVRGLKSHTSLKLFVLSGLTSSPTLVEIPPIQPLLRGGRRGERRGRRRVAWCLFVDSDLLVATQTLRKARNP